MTRRLLAGLLLVLCGCPARGQAPGRQPSWRGDGDPPVASEPRVIELRPVSLAATAYNDLALGPPPHSALGDAVVAAVERAAAASGRPAPVADARLFQAATELARIAPDDAPLSYGLIEFALQYVGIMEPSPHLVIIRAPIDEPGAIAEKLDERLPAILAGGEFARVGIGAAERSGGDDVIVLALQSSFLSTRPVPRVLPAAGHARLEGEVGAPFVEPEVFVTRPAGEVEALPLTRVGARGFRAELVCGEHIGRQQVEINAHDATGATVLANFPVWCGAEPPVVLALELDEEELRAVTRGDVAEARMLRLVNRDRAKNGAPALALDPRLTAVARAHSEDMRRTGLIAHISPTTGSAADRTRAAGVRSAVVLENVARAYGVGEAEEGLMNSPGHRANLLSREVTQIGIGIVLGEEVAGRRELFVTQVFIRVPQKLDVKTARPELDARIRAARALEGDPALAEIAQRFADALAAGDDAQAAAGRAAERLRKLGTSYSKVTTIATTVADLAAFQPASSLADRSIKRYGLGLAQGDHPELGEGAMHIVLLLGHK